MTIDPVARYVFRQWLTWGAIAPAVAVTIAIWTTNLAPVALLRLIGLFAILYGPAHAAARFVEMDRSGRFDHFRLTGRSPRRLFWAVAFGSAAPLLLAGIVVLIASRPAWPSIGTIFVMTIFFGGSVALAMLALALPRRDFGTDTRVVTLGIAAAVMLVTATQRTMLDTAGRLNLTALAAIAVFESAVIIMAAKRAFPAIARPWDRVVPISPPRIPLVAWMPFPIKRGWALTVGTAIWLSAIVGVLLALTDGMRRYGRPAGAFPVGEMAVFLPLLVGAFVVSSIARADRDSGRFDIVRVSPRSPLLAVAGFAAGSWLPFVMVTTAAAIAARLVWETPLDNWAMAMIVLAVVAAAPLVEGWHQRWPMTYTLPLGGAFSLLILRQAAWIDVPLWQNPAIIQRASIVWVVWAGAWRTWRRPDMPPLSGAVSIAVTCCIAISNLWRVSNPRVAVQGVELTAAALIATAAFWVDPRRLTMHAVGAALAGGTAAALLLFEARHPANIAAFGFVSVAAAAWAGIRLHHAFRVPRGLSTIVRLGAVMVIAGAAGALMLRFEVKGAMARDTVTLTALAIAAEAACWLVPPAMARARAILRS